MRANCRYPGDIFQDLHDLQRVGVLLALETYCKARRWWGTYCKARSWRWYSCSHSPFWIVLWILYRREHNGESTADAIKLASASVTGFAPQRSSVAGSAGKRKRRRWKIPTVAANTIAHHHFRIGHVVPARSQLVFPKRRRGGLKLASGALGRLFLALPPGPGNDFRESVVCFLERRGGEEGCRFCSTGDV